MFSLTEVTNKKKTEYKQSKVRIRKSTTVCVFVASIKRQKDNIFPVFVSLVTALELEGIKARY